MEEKKRTHKKAGKDQQDRQKQWVKESLWRPFVGFKKDDEEFIKYVAAMSGKSVNAYITTAVMAKAKRDYRDYKEAKEADNN